jgi:hypothetical protein
MKAFIRRFTSTARGRLSAVALTAAAATLTMGQACPGNGRTLSFDAAVPYGEGGSIGPLAVGDFGGDGRPDLVVVNNSSLSVFSGGGDGTFVNPISSLLPTDVAAAHPNTIAAADFNRDGRLDVVVTTLASTSDGSNLFVFFGNGDGTFSAPARYAAVLGTATLLTGAVVADMNGDGVPDLAVANVTPDLTSGSVSILLGRGDGTLLPPAGATVGRNPFSLVGADLNGDGYLDLAVADANSTSLAVLLGNGDGTLRAPTAATGGPANSIAVGDLNGDGKADLVITSSNGSNSIAVLLGNGDGTFQTAVSYAAGTNPTSVAIADFDGDGTIDVAVASSSDGTVSVLLGNGDGTLQAGVRYTAGSNLTSLLARDFNGDGLTDLAVVDGSTGAVVVLMNTSSDSSSLDATTKPAVAAKRPGLSF